MLATATLILDWLGIVVFAITGGLVASRKEMDIVGFALMASVTGIGGGTIRDLLLGLTPVFWVRAPLYLLVCVLAGMATFFLAHHLSARMRLLLWLDAVGLAVFTVTGARVAMDSGAGATIAIAMGVATGITLEFQFGTNWAYYSHYVGDIFGVPLAIEGMMAFFLESTFVGLFFFF